MRMAKKPAKHERLTQLESRLRRLQGMSRLSFLFFCLCLGGLAVATAFPQTRKLRQLQSDLEEVRRLEMDVMEELSLHQTELRALREDPAFLELHARDRLDYHLEGEKVLKIKRH